MIPVTKNDDQINKIRKNSSNSTSASISITGTILSSSVKPGVIKTKFSTTTEVKKRQRQSNKKNLQQRQNNNAETTETSENEQQRHQQ